MRRFYLFRREDVSGVSGTGRVADGVKFNDGVCVIHWAIHTTATTIYNNIKDVLNIHGHDRKTIIEWIDKEDVQ